MIRQTESIQILQKLSIVNQFYTCLEEQDLQQFTHDQLRRLSTVLSKHDPNLLQGQDKKINHILVQRSYAHIKNFTNKYKGFNFNINMFENGYHRQRVEGRINKPNSNPNPLSTTIGVSNIQPYEDILNAQSKSKETPQKQKQILTNPSELLNKQIKQNQPMQHQINTTQNHTKMNQSQKQQESNRPNDRVETQPVAVDRKNRDWNTLPSDDEDYLEVKEDQSQKDDNQWPAVGKDQDSQHSFSLSDDQATVKLLLADQQSQKVKIPFQFNESQLTKNQSTNKIFQDDLADQAVLNENEAQKYTQDRTIRHLEKAECKDSDVQSFQLDQKQLDEEQDAIDIWAVNDPNPDQPISPNPHPIQRIETSSIESFSAEDEDEYQDFDQIKSKRIQQETNKQIHPTLKRFYQQKERKKNQHHEKNQNKSSKLIINQKKAQNGIDYIKERQLR